MWRTWSALYFSVGISRRPGYQVRREKFVRSLAALWLRSSGQHWQGDTSSPFLKDSLGEDKDKTMASMCQCWHRNVYSKRLHGKWFNSRLRHHLLACKITAVIGDEPRWIQYKTSTQYITTRMIDLFHAQNVEPKYNFFMKYNSLLITL